MKFDFLYHTYTLTITVFAAVFGMAYPLKPLRGLTRNTLRLSYLLIYENVGSLRHLIFLSLSALLVLVYQLTY